MLICSVCNHKNDDVTLCAKEMMHGTGQLFDYFICDHCGCISLVDPPPNMAEYYPAGYSTLQSKFRLQQWLINQYAMTVFGKQNLVGNLIQYLIATEDRMESIARIAPDKTASILDVGCGRGALVEALAYAGFCDVTGIDPFAPANRAGKSFRIVAQDIETHQGSYDLIMFHHVLEHLPNQHMALSHAKRLLKPNGKILIRIPLSDSEAYETYGTDWVQLDPPRHWYLHTKKSMKILSKHNDLTITSVTYDSSAFQFLGSIQYQQGIALFSDKSYFPKRRWIKWIPKLFNNTVFTRHDILHYEQKAKALNQRERGDQACFILEKASHIVSG